MSESAVRNEWTRVTFGEMAENVAERAEPTPADGETYVGLEHLDSGSLTVRRWGADVALVGTKLRMRRGDILFARRNAYLRRVAIAPHDGLFSAHGLVLRARPNVVHPQFLPFFMQSDAFMERAKAISVGSLSPTINWRTLANEAFVIPPKEEQRRIATVLRASACVGDASTRLANSLEAVRQAAIDEFTNNAQWPERAVGELCKMQNGRAFPGTAYAGDGIRLLRPGNLGQRGYLDWASSKTVWLSRQWERDAADVVIGPGEVLMNLTAQSLEDGFMGRVCLTREGDRSLLNQRIGRFVDWAADVLPEYGFRAFQSSRFQLHAIKMCEGSKVKHLFWPHIARYTFRVPPRDEQIAVVTALQEMDTSLARQAERAMQHRALHQLLSGVALRNADFALSRSAMSL